MKVSVAIEKNGVTVATAEFQMSADSDENRANGIKALDEAFKNKPGLSWADDVIIKFKTIG